MIIPPPLQPGDAIGIIAPSSSFDPHLLQEALTYFSSLGLRCLTGKSLHAKERYLAGSDRERADDINYFFSQAEIRALFAARGGYGSARLLPLLAYNEIAVHPKILIGFSDTTALQFGIYSRTGLVSYTGFMLTTDFHDGLLHPTLEHSLRDVLFNSKIPPLSSMEIIKSGSAQGPVIAGCLSVICSLIGTQYLPNLNGTILIIEDVNEEPYKLDRMINQLRQAGILRVLSGLIAGRFIGCEGKNPAHGNLEPIIRELIGDVNGPILSGLDYGHFPGRIMLPVGAQGRITTHTGDGELTITLANNIPQALSSR